MRKRDTYTYRLEKKGKIVHKGITNDLKRREGEHQTQFPGSKIVKEGRVKTRESALEWEQHQKAKYVFTPQRRGS